MQLSKKISVLISLPILFSVSNFVTAGSFDDAFKNAKTTGQLRLGYISVAPDVAGNPTTTGAGVGGEIKFETAKWNNIQFAIAPYFIEKLDALTADVTAKTNGDYFNSTNQGYAYIGEAYINYNFGKGGVRLGRQKLDTPFINTDDIRMFSNTFTAAWLNINLTKALTLQTGLVSAWAGFDSGSSQEKFKKASNNGVTALGANYKYNDSLAAQAWYYNFDKEYSLLYLDTTYTTGGVEIGAQVANFTEAKSTSTKNADGSIIGVSVSYTTGPFTFSAVMNSGANATGKSADLGLGGGNFYAAMDETTIAGLNDVQARVLSFKYAVSNKFTAGVALGHFEDKTKASNKDETDLMLGYNVSDTLGLEFVHTVVDNKGAPADTATNFSRQTARVTYTF